MASTDRHGKTHHESTHPPETPRYHFTAEEEARLLDLMIDDWRGGMLWAWEKLGIPLPEVFTVVANTLGTDPEITRQRRRDERFEQMAQRRHVRRILTKLSYGLAYVAALAAAWHHLSAESFLSAAFPLLTLLIVTISVTQKDVAGGGWLALGIPMVLVSGIVAVALQGDRPSFPPTALPLMVLANLGMTIGVALFIFNKFAHEGAEHRQNVVAARAARRLGSINLGAQAIIINLAAYWVGLRHDGFDEDQFNAIARFMLFAPALGLLLGFSLGAVSTQLRRAVMAVVLPVGSCVLHTLESGQTLYGFVLQWALIDILTVLFVMPLAAGHVGDKDRFIGVAIGLGGALVLGLLALGMLIMISDELTAIESLSGWMDFTVWIIVPALLAAADETGWLNRMRFWP